MKTKYTKKQITEAIKHWQKVLESMQLNESVFDRAYLLRDFSTNLSYLDKSLAEKTKHDLEMIKSMIEELPDTHVDSYEGKKVPLENQLAYAIVGFWKTLVLCDATTKNSVNEDCKSANDFVIVNGKKISTDGAIVDNGINWIYFWFDTEDAALDWYKREFGIEYNRDLLVKPTKRDMPGKFDDKFGIGMHK